MRIGFICVTQETNDFNPRLTTLDDFRSYQILKDAELEQISGTGQYGGFEEAVAESGLAIEMVPILRGNAVAGGRISREAFDYFHREIEEGLARAGKLDGLVLNLHGACAAEGVDDVEGEQIALCRRILGPGVPIGFGLDHHAHISPKMVENADVIVGHLTQPHNPFETSKIATQLLLRLLTENIRVTTAWRHIPMLSHQEQFFTDRPPMGIWFDRARAIEKADPRVLQASNYPMQPWLDVAGGGWSTIVCTIDDQDLAETYADELADLAWSLRERFQVKQALPIDEAVLKADAAEKGLVLLSDTGDTVFGGSSGDSNLILEAMLRLGIKGPALVPMIAPKVAEKLHAAGEGATVTLKIGGETATGFFSPIEVTGVVRKLGSGFIETPGFRGGKLDQGKSAIFEIGPVTMLITELRGAGGNVPAVYETLGVDPHQYKMAVMKTATAFRNFDGYSSQVIRVDTTGPGQSDILTLPWKRIPRPIYPLDSVTDWRAHSLKPGPKR